jgi:tetratricopeptide (TPR) repeat protein
MKTQAVRKLLASVLSLILPVTLFDAVVVDHGQAVQVDAKLAFAYRTRGTAKAQKGDLDDAIADYNQAIKLDPKNDLAYSMRALPRHERVTSTEPSLTAIWPSS